MENAMEQKVVYVGFWARVLASVIDTICFSLVLVPLAIMYYGTEYFVAGRDIGIAGRIVFYGLPAVAVIIFWLARGATPGKMVIGALVVDAATLGKLGTGQAILRYVGYYVSTIPLLLGLIWVGFDSRKQGWHDKIAGTLVIKASKGGA